MSRKLPGINTSSMADISFLLLTFFLLTSSISSEQGITRMLPKYSEKQNEEDVEINERNVLSITVSKFNTVRITGAKWMGENAIEMGEKSKCNNWKGEIKDNLYKYAKEFLANPYDEPLLPEKKDENIVEADFGLYSVSQGVISLKCDNNAFYTTYVEVHNELSKAVNELREELSKKKYGKSFKALEEGDDKEKEKAAAIKKAIPMNISEATSK